MRSEIIKKIQAETQDDSRIFAKKYADIVIRINDLLKRNNYSQKDLAGKMEKTPSEISKWLNGEHNFTIRSISKLEAEFGEVILYIPKRKKMEITEGLSFDVTMIANNHWKKNSKEDNSEHEYDQVEKICSK